MGRAVLALVVLPLCLAACGGGGGERSGTSAAQPASTEAASTAAAERARQEALVDIGGRRLHLVCLGEGTPTVVLDHGLEGSSQNWLAVHDRAAAEAGTRVCAYDRAGRRPSDRAEGTRTGEDLAQDLHRLLAAADLGSPVVLVGHSIAGLHFRLFAARHPDEVAAMVLVDASHPDRYQRAAAVLPAPSPQDSAQLRAFREVVERGDPRGAANRERLEVGTTHRQVRRTGTLGDVPLVVLTGGAVVQRETQGDFPPEHVRRLQEAHETMQAEMAALSSNSVHVVVPDAGHFIQDDQPDAVVAAIRAAVETVRDGGRIAERLPPA